jgi:hypothetical protein
MDLSIGIFGGDGAQGLTSEVARAVFGLVTGQIRGHDLFSKAGWYNEKGEKLGWGDISPRDVKNIQNYLELGQAFILLSENASYWSFTKFHGRADEVHPSERAPGIDYCLQNAKLVITKSGLFCRNCERYIAGESEDKFLTKMIGVPVRQMSEGELRNLLRS